MKICLLGATFDTNNMGVSALTAGTIKCIIHQFPDAEIYLLDYGKDTITYNLQIDHRSVPIQLINMRFSKKVYLKNNIALLLILSLVINLIPSQKIRKNLFSRNFCLKHICEADIITSIAGGDSFSDIYGMGRFFYVSLPQVLSLFLGKKLVLLPQTIGPFNGTIVKFIARYIMNRVSIVYSRDYTGLREAKNFLGAKYDSKKLRFCYDVGIVVDPVKPHKIDLDGLFEKRKDNSNIIGLNVSGLLFMGGYTQNNMFGLKIDYRKFIYNLIDFLIRRKNVTVLLVPHVFGFLENSESDSIICEKIYNELKPTYKDKLFLVKGTYNQSEIKWIIGLCDFFIGSRMHACIAALSQNVPAVAIAYSKKFLGVMETLDLETHIADPRSLCEKNILNIIDKMYGQRKSTRKHLNRIIPKVKNAILNLFNEMGEIFHV
jgi:polysaccharide pyruvyl transferase WcaK-like protein